MLVTLEGFGLLDDTLIVWGSEHGDPRLHSYKNVPFVLAGGSQGAFGMGRYLKLGNQPHNKLLVSVLRAFGITDVDSFGAGTESITGTLPGL